jgi:nucleolar protein 53
MGRKLRGAALRAHKRGKAHATEIIELKADQVETAEVTQKSNDELFVIDTTGDKKAILPKIIKEKLLAATSHGNGNNSKKNELPKLDQEKVEQLIKKHNPKKLQAMVKVGQAKLRGDRNAVKRSQRNRKVPGKYDLWEKDTDTRQTVRAENARINKTSQIGGIKAEAHVQRVAETISKAPKDAVAVDIAHSGQSYRPDPKAYHTVVQDAVSLEVRRQKAQDNAKAPLATGMSPETRALLVGDSDTSDDESETDEKDTATNNDNNHLIMPKRQNKLTRAERNKQKRLRLEKAIQDQARQKKKLLNSIAEVPRYKKEIKKQAKELLEKKEQVQAIKDSSKPTPGKNVIERVAKEDPINVPTLPVSLEEEHKDASLRTIKPKGSLLTDRMASFADRKLVSKKRVGERKRIRQGKRRKLSVKGKGHEIAKAMDYAMMG